MRSECGAIVTLGFQVCQEGQHEGRVELFELQLRRRHLAPRARERQQQLERVGVRLARVLAGALLEWQAFAQVCRQVRRESGHEAPPRKWRSVVDAIADIREGVACRYQ